MIIGGLILTLFDGIIYFTIGCLTISVCAGIGNGLVFKLVPSYFSKEAGSANGIVSMMGGLGGFFPPLVITFVHRTNRFKSSCIWFISTICTYRFNHNGSFI